jgi:hypothetical protein
MGPDTGCRMPDAVAVKSWQKVVGLSPKGSVPVPI